MPITRRSFVALGAAAAVAQASKVGPAKGSLIVIGGGVLDASILRRFIEAAGGADAPVFFVPTAGDKTSYGPQDASANFLRQAGCRNLEMLHTVSRAEANSEAFAARLARARGVFFGGGRQWRLVDSYLGTRTQREFEAVLRRGGVIAGSSAGATIQGSYLVRGAREGNTILMAPGYEKGFGYLRRVAIDQHLTQRNRQKDLLAVIARHPELLGIGLDENTAIVVQADRFEVVGLGRVAIYDRGALPHYFLNPGDHFDLVRRQLVNPSQGVPGQHQRGDHQPASSRP